MNRADRGFTLLEVVVALAVLGLAVVALIQGFAQGLRLLKLSGEHQRAALLADEKVREVTRLADGREAGEDDEFRWERLIQELPAPELAPPGPGAPRWRLYEIAVVVRWGERRQVEVRTLRTVPAGAPAEPAAFPGGPGPR